MKKTNLMIAGALLGCCASAAAFMAADKQELIVRNGSDEVPVESVKNHSTGKGVVRMPMRDSEAMSSGLYAYSVSGENGAKAGLYSTSVNGDMTLMWEAAEEGWHMFNGWMNNGNLCGFVRYQPSGNVEGIKYQEYEFDSGKVLLSTELDAKDYLNLFSYCTFIPEKNVIFGVGVDSNNWSCVKTMNMDDFSDVNIIANINYTKYIVALCYNPIDGNVYAVTETKDLVRIDQTTGDYETILHLDIPSINTRFKHGLVYLPTADEYLYAASLSDYSTVYYRVDVTSGVVIETAQLANNDVVTYFVTTDEGDMEAPVRPEYDGIQFPEGALSGTISFTLPLILAGGNDAPDTLSWLILANGEEVAAGEGKPGEKVLANATLPEGKCLLEIVASNGTHESPSTKVDLFIGPDTPMAPANVTLTEGKVTWDAVTESVNGGYIDLEELYYEVYVDDEYIGETTATEMTFEVDADSEFMRHVAEVKAISGEKESAQGLSNYCAYGSAMSLDVMFTPTEEEASLFTSISSDAPDALKWGYDSWSNAFATNVPQADGECWIVTPPLKLDDSKIIYSLDFESYIDIWTGGESLLGVYLGTSELPSDMSRVLFEPFVPTDTYQPKHTIFAVPEGGIYYVGFYVKSEDHSYRTYLRNISVKKTTISPDAPVACGNLLATAADKGELSALVSFTMPELNLIGQQYDSDRNITAIVSVGENSVTASGKPGSEQEVSIPTAQGMNTITIVCEVDGNQGAEAATDVYTGFDVPGAPLNFKATVGEDNHTVTFTWEAPEEGATGKWFEPSDLTYRIGYALGWSVIYLDCEVVDEFEYSYVYPDAALTNLTFFITATNQAGTGPDVVLDAPLVLGDPYTIPVSDDFSEGKYKLWPVFLEYPSENYEDASMLFQIPYYFNEKFEKTEHPAIGIVSTVDETCHSRLVLPKFTPGSKDNKVLPAVWFEIWCGESMAKSIKLYGRSWDTEEPVEIGEVTPATGWNTVWFDIPAQLAEKEWIEVYLESEYDQPDTFTMIYSYGYDISTGAAMLISGEPSITAKGRYVYFNGYEDKEYAVYTLGGLVVKSGKTTVGQTVVGLEPGVYVARCGDKSAKIVIR